MPQFHHLIDCFVTPSPLAKSIQTSSAFLGGRSKCSSQNNNSRRGLHTHKHVITGNPPKRPPSSFPARDLIRSSSEAARQVPENVAAILLAGGTGSRMKADRPKQFLLLRGKTVLEHSILLFGQMKVVKQLIIVISEEYRDQFQSLIDTLPCDVQFASPGEERQDSVFNGLALVSDNMSLACIHDAARPLVTQDKILHVLSDAEEHGAAVLGVPSKATIKESEDGEFVLRTIPRSRLWEIQTPQVIKPKLLRKGFDKVKAENLAVTDDVSIVEYLGEPVKITMGEYTNIKLTTPEDMNIAESILQERQQAASYV